MVERAKDPYWQRLLSALPPHTTAEERAWVDDNTDAVYYALQCNRTIASQCEIGALMNMEGHGVHMRIVLTIAQCKDLEALKTLDTRPHVETCHESLDAAAAGHRPPYVHSVDICILCSTDWCGCTTTFLQHKVGYYRICNVCRKIGTKRDGFGSCGQCRDVYYCGEDCQRKDWSVHRDECVH